MPGLSRQHAGASGDVSRLEAPDGGGVLRALSVGRVGVISRTKMMPSKVIADPGLVVRAGRVDVDPHPTVLHLRTLSQRWIAGSAPGG
jgi:hypothetical protein